MKPVTHWMASWALALPASFGAQACGVCLEDKVAAAYDHATVARALKSGRVMVFAEVAGEGDIHRRVLAVRAAAARVKGVDASSVRAAESPAVVSFALDASQRSP